MKEQHCSILKEHHCIYRWLLAHFQGVIKDLLSRYLILTSNYRTFMNLDIGQTAGYAYNTAKLNPHDIKIKRWMFEHLLKSYSFAWELRTFLPLHMHCSITAKGTTLKSSTWKTEEVFCFLFHTKYIVIDCLLYNSAIYLTQPACVHFVLPIQHC